jgi:hypothetical protein
MATVTTVKVHVKDLQTTLQTIEDATKTVIHVTAISTNRVAISYK